MLISPVIPPDGTQVAWRGIRRLLGDNTRETRLYLGDVKSGRTRQLSFTDAGTGGLAWCPDGGLSFLREYDEASQVWINALDGAEPRPLTDLDGGVSAYWWSPDGKYLPIALLGPDDNDALLAR